MYQPNKIYYHNPYGDEHWILRIHYNNSAFYATAEIYDEMGAHWYKERFPLTHYDERWTHELPLEEWSLTVMKGKYVHKKS